jgi:hypothetical protein
VTKPAVPDGPGSDRGAEIPEVRDHLQLAAE